jgi:hypothetical protein
MKFDCGPTYVERHERRQKAWEDYKASREQWHPYFCWWPKRIGSNDCRWLETVERRGYYNEPIKMPFGGGCAGGWSWEYRSIK